MSKEIFDIAKEISDLSDSYHIKLDSVPEDKSEIYETFINQLDECHSKLLKLGKYSENPLNIVAVSEEKINNLPSYSQVNILYKYDDGYALVEDTAMELHLVPFKRLKIEEKQI